MDATAAVVLQFDDGFELTKEVNDLAVVSPSEMIPVFCAFLFFSRPTVWYRTPPTTHAE
jgi:hypothetical protein